MNLIQWSIKWSIPLEAIEDLRREFGMTDTDPEHMGGESEAAIQTRIRLEATCKGGRLWRNNVGGTYTVDGGFIRYGLANDSKQMNSKIKSSDLIGLKPVAITQGHVGGVIGQFVAREVKAEGWSFSGTPREQAQLTFLEIVVALGGDAAFANRSGTL